MKKWNKENGGATAGDKGVAKVLFINNNATTQQGKEKVDL